MKLLRHSHTHDAELRATIHAGTDKSESFNVFSKGIAFGYLGTFPTNNYEEQRKRVKHNYFVASFLILHKGAES